MFTTNLEDGREAPSKARKKGAKRLEFLVFLYFFSMNLYAYGWASSLYFFRYSKTLASSGGRKISFFIIQRFQFEKRNKIYHLLKNDLGKNIVFFDPSKVFIEI